MYAKAIYITDMSTEVFSFIIGVSGFIIVLLLTIVGFYIKKDYKAQQTKTKELSESMGDLGNKVDALREEMILLRPNIEQIKANRDEIQKNSKEIAKNQAEVAKNRSDIDKNKQDIVKLKIKNKGKSG